MAKPLHLDERLSDAQRAYVLGGPHALANIFTNTKLNDPTLTIVRTVRVSGESRHGMVYEAGMDALRLGTTRAEGRWWEVGWDEAVRVREVAEGARVEKEREAS